MVRSIPEAEATVMRMVDRRREWHLAMRRRSARVRGMALVMGALLGCGDAGSVAERRVRPVVWDTAWVASAEVRELLPVPGPMARDADALYLFDVSLRHVIAVDRGTGALRWRVGRPGSGPGEFLQPVFIGVLSDSSIGVLDQATRRLTVLSSRGELLGTHPLINVMGAPESFCSLGDGRLLLSAFGRDSLIERGADGRILSERPKPRNISDPRGLRSSTMVAGSDGACVALLFRGGGGTIHGADGDRREFAYVAGLELSDWVTDSVGERVLAPSAPALFWATVEDDVISTLVWRSDDEPLRVLDEYDGVRGGYLGSWRLPARANYFVRRKDTLFVQLADSGEVVNLVALTARRGD